MKTSTIHTCGQEADVGFLLRGTKPVAWARGLTVLPSLLPTEHIATISGTCIPLIFSGYQSPTVALMASCSSTASPYKVPVKVSHVSCLPCMQEMKKCVETVRGMRDHNDSDAFFLCVMSHGTEGAVYGVDGEKVDIKADIVGPFHQDRCKALCGKPKVFLFQACEGGSLLTFFQSLFSSTLA